MPKQTLVFESPVPIGKEIFTVQGEYSANMLRKAVLKEEEEIKAAAQVPARPPILCPG